LRGIPLSIKIQDLDPSQKVKAVFILQYHYLQPYHPRVIPGTNTPADGIIQAISQL